MSEFLNIEDLTEEDINAILGLGTGEDRAEQLRQQLAAAQGIRNREGPEGRGYGGIYTAANPLEHAVSAWEKIKAGKDAERITQDQGALMEEQTAARKRFLEAFMKQKAMTQPQQYGPEAFQNPGVY